MVGSLPQFEHGYDLDQFTGLRFKATRGCGHFFDQCCVLLGDLVHLCDSLTNLGYAAGAPLPEACTSWFRCEAPKLQPSSGRLGLWRLTDASPAKDAAVENGAPVTEDIFGRPRSGHRDIGAEEFSPDPPRRLPLTSALVGPEAP